MKVKHAWEGLTKYIQIIIKPAQYGRALAIVNVKLLYSCRYVISSKRNTVNSVVKKTKKIPSRSKIKPHTLKVRITAKKVINFFLMLAFKNKCEMVRSVKNK